MFAARAFLTIAQIMSSGEKIASASQMLIAAVAVLCCDATKATIIDRTPIATIPHPETAVKAPAASIVLRMNARLSIARA